MRAAIYARYSSDNQRDASIEDQVRECRVRLEHEGWDLAEVYSDHGISGATILRPAYQNLLEDMRRGHFEVIVTEALDRLSRDQENVAALYKQASFAGVNVVTLAEGEISELHVGFSGAMNALYLKHLAQKTHRGLEGRVRQGRSGGGICYGYDVDGGGEEDRGKRRINSAEAEIVRRIFRDYAAGKSPRKVAYELNVPIALADETKKQNNMNNREHLKARKTGSGACGADIVPKYWREFAACRRRLIYLYKATL